MAESLQQLMRLHSDMAAMPPRPPCASPRSAPRPAPHPRAGEPGRRASPPEAPPPSSSCRAPGLQRGRSNRGGAPLGPICCAHHSCHCCWRRTTRSHHSAPRRTPGWPQAAPAAINGSLGRRRTASTGGPAAQRAEACQGARRPTQSRQVSGERGLPPQQRTSAQVAVPQLSRRGRLGVNAPQAASRSPETTAVRHRAHSAAAHARRALQRRRSPEREPRRRPFRARQPRPGADVEPQRPVNPGRNPTPERSAAGEGPVDAPHIGWAVREVGSATQGPPNTGGCEPCHHLMAPRLNDIPDGNLPGTTHSQTPTTLVRASRRFPPR